MVGIGTVLADDPRLTARNLRDGTLAIRQPLRVVVDSSGRTPEGALVRDGAAPTWIATVAEVGAGADGRVDLVALLAGLHTRGVRAVLLEGGPALAGAFLAAGLVDRVIGYIAPKLLGAGPNALGDAGVRTIAEVIDLDYTDVARVGPDLRFTALPRKKEG
jgi:diaminohydroxyphosphoribosylaminopyrimidine deaminase/5-amino-6-(5-phosphoribosylamino)uracil reductase